MNKKTANLLVVLILAISITLLAYTITRVNAAATIWTDKADYSPEETVYISGSGFLPNTEIAGTVIRPTLPDPTTDSWTIMSDDLGYFVYAYLLDGVTGTYTVTATDGTNTAITTFTDTVYRYYTATISPTSSLAGQTQTYTVRITNDLTTSASQAMQTATISIPSAFTSVSLSASPNPVVSNPSKTWTASIVSGVIQLASVTGTDKLDPGEYVSVSFSAKAPSPSTATDYEWTTAAYQGSTAYDLLGNQPKVTVAAGFESFTVSGVKKDTSDNLLSDWKINLFKSPDWVNPVATATTADTTGAYSFTITSAGDYRISEEAQYGWTRITPSSPTYYSFTATSGHADITNQDFVNFKWLTISGTKYVTGTTTGLPYWTMKLYIFDDYDEEYVPYDSATTASSGYYSFSVRNPGMYEINEVLPTGWTLTSPVSHVGPPSGTIEVTGYTDITVSSGTNIPNRNFYNFKWLTISGTKYVTGTTTGLPYWTMKLYIFDDYDEEYVPYDSVTTGSFGHYSFTVKHPGMYEISEILKIGWTATSPTYQVGDAATTKEVIGYTDITVSSGSNIGGRNFFNFQWLTISGTKYKTGTATGLSGWEINLYIFDEDVDDYVFYASTNTGSAGSYSFTVKDPGTYAITEVLQDKWTETSPSLEYSPGNGFPIEVLGYEDISVQSGTNIPNKNFKNFQWLTISGTKFETGTYAHLSGWTMKLYNSSDDSLYASATTALTTGAYSFTVKDPGTYYIAEVLPTGWTLTGPVYQVGPVSGSVEVTGYSGITVSSGMDVVSEKFYNFKWLTISGTKFFDADGDGGRDTGEPGLQYWSIKLYSDSTLYGTTATASDGSYSFLVKDPGTYSIKEILKTPWYETTPAPAGPGDGTTPILGYSGIIVISGTDVTGKDFGNWLGSSSYVTTSGLGYFDVDNNPANGRQFKLIFTPDVPTNPNLYRLTASNPGQFYYNIFYTGSGTTSFTINIPYPFVTQGANPIHVYSSLNTAPDGSLVPGTDVTSQFTISPSTISLDDWAGKTFGNTISITVSGPSSGFLYINVHLDYGLKQNIGALTQSSKTPPMNALGLPTSIYDNVAYGFSVTGTGGFTSADTVKNMNVFKRDPGFVGQVTNSEDAPVANVKVQIYGPDGKLLATVYTDKDGWYFYNYKYTGKAATFTIKLPEYKISKSVTIKSNGMTVTNFVIP